MMAEDTSQQAADGQQEHFFVTKASQQNKAPAHRKFSYTGTRDLTDVQKIQELDIVAEDGTIRGMKNRVRAGQAHFDNPVARAKKREEEGKVIVYVTGFGGVRSVNDDCRYVLTVLHNFRVSVEERDIYLNKYYYHELQERLQVEDKVPMPQVFINGQHIGGKEELEMLNESGELRKVLTEIPRTKVMLTCSTCGGYKFIPCRKCGGSKNSVANNFTWEFKALKCTGCNENGLQPCPDCESKQEETEEDKQHKEKITEYEKQQRLKKEMAEAERLQKIEAERKAQERAKKKEEKERKAREKRERKEKARKLREKEAILEAARQRIVADISEEIQKERAWKLAHGLLDEQEEESTDQNKFQDSSDQDSSEQSSSSSQDISNQDTQDQDTSDHDRKEQDTSNRDTVDDNTRDRYQDTSDHDRKEQDTSNRDTVDDNTRDRYQDNSEHDAETQTNDKCSQSCGDQQDICDGESEIDNITESEDDTSNNIDNEAETNF